VCQVTGVPESRRFDLRGLRDDGVASQHCLQTGQEAAAIEQESGAHANSAQRRHGNAHNVAAPTVT